MTNSINANSSVANNKPKSWTNTLLNGIRYANNIINPVNLNICNVLCTTDKEYLTQNCLIFFLKFSKGSTFFHKSMLFY